MSKFLKNAKAELAKLEAREGKYKGDCADCKFVIKDYLMGDGWHKCSNPVVQVVAFNQSDAYHKQRIQMCSEQRDVSSLYGAVVCGPDGELFEPRKTFFERLFK